MTTHHDDDDAWLDALAGKKSAVQNTQAGLLREIMLRKHEQLLASIEKSDEEINSIRQRLDKENLLTDKPKESRLKRLREWLMRHRQSAWVGALASLLLLIGTVSNLQVGQKVILSEPDETFRGGNESGTSNSQGIFEGLVVVGRQTQIVSDVEAARLEWEADLISSGLVYRVGKSAGEEGIQLHIMLSNNIDLLNAGHRRVFNKSPTTGEFIVTLQAAK